MTGDFYVYLISRPDGRPCYVGKGKWKRWVKHAWRSTNPHLACIYAQNSGTLPIRKIADGLTEIEAFALERGEIARIGREANGGPLVNLTDGGEGPSGHRHSEEARQKMSAKSKGRQTRLGHKHSPETLAKMSAAKIGRKHSPQVVESRVASLRGRKRPPEVGAKIAAAKTGKKASPETRAALRAGNRSRDPEVRARISAALIERNAERGNRACASTNV